MRKTGSPTIKDVARLAECSPSVVSIVLNKAKGNTMVGDAMRQKVQEIARRIGYRPHFAGRCLINRQTRTLGLYFPPEPWTGLGRQYEGRLLSGIERACRQAGYDLLLINLTGEQSRQDCCQKLAEQRIDGLLIFRSDRIWDSLGDFMQYTNHLVLVDSPQSHPQIPCVVFDHSTAMTQAMQYLLAMGHRRIGFLGTCLSNPDQAAIIRQRAFIQAAEQLGLKQNPAWVFDQRFCPVEIRRQDECNQLEGYWGIKHMLSLPQRPTALIAHGDLVALGAYDALAEAGLSIPNDISLMGIGDSERCRYVRPHLTSLRQPIEEIGYESAQYLIEITQKGSSPDSLVLGTSGSPCRLVVLNESPAIIERESVKRL